MAGRSNKESTSRARTLRYNIRRCLLWPKGSKYHYSSYLVAIWALKVHTILVLGSFGRIPSDAVADGARTDREPGTGLTIADSRETEH